MKLREPRTPSSSPPDSKKKVTESIAEEKQDPNEENVTESKAEEKGSPEDIIQTDKKKMRVATEEFHARLKQYLGIGIASYREDGKENEFEIRFGTNSFSGRPLSKIDYDNVVKQLLKHGFKTDLPNGSQYLRINYQDSLTDDRIMSNVRAEIVGSTMIQEYCRTNSIQTMINMPQYTFNKIQFTRKSLSRDEKGSWQKPIDMFDMGFRVSYQLEESFTTSAPFIKPVINTWGDRKKTFRLMNRVRFSHPDYPIFADISIVRSSKKYVRSSATGGGAFKRPSTNVQIPKYTIQEAGVFNAAETYEIELEIDNRRVGMGSNHATLESVMNALRQCIRIVLCGIQQCFYPISYTERDVVLNQYMRLVENNDKRHHKKINMGNKYEFSKSFVFIGPGSITLQREHILPKKEGSTMVSVLTNYTVTDKADGERKLLYINDEGRLYLIDNRFNVQFTGMKTDEKTIYNSLLDGELVKFDKHGHPLNLYAAFDIYFVNGKSFREKNFYPESSDDLPNNYRLLILQQFVTLLKPSSIVGEKPIQKWQEMKDKKGNPMWGNYKSGEITKIRPKMEYSCKLVVQCKRFEVVSDSKTIFECCSNIMKDITDGLLPYHTDGLIFTPTNAGVGGDAPGVAGPLSSATWEHSMKWKPADQNTVDFLVTVKTDKTGKEEVTHVYQDGINTGSATCIDQYKTLELMCGFNAKTDGYMNPYQDVLDNRIPSNTDRNQSNTDYHAALFRPTDPYDANAYITKVKLHDDGTSQYMVSEEGDYFESFNIVEFRYDKSRPNDSRWVPLRLRTDKTQQLKNGDKQFGNAFRVANSNWKSIHYPVTEEMITTGEGIPDIVEEGVYYKGNQENNTQGLRDFHNLYVKKSLILGVSRRGDTLIDYAVGMAGDLPKWVSSRLGFVFGIDVSHSNIHNNKRGACARFLNVKRDNPTIPDCLFTVGNSSLNIRSLKAFPGDTHSKDKMVANAVFGKGPKDATVIGKGTVAQYGKGEPGFQISSCQFALHYFFENKVTLHGFLRNLAECTRDQGYFIGTCYDGKTIFKSLSKKKEGESILFSVDDTRICEIVKKYGDTGFPVDDTSLGYKIDVYQESINQYVPEFLVCFDYFVEMMDNYGFKLVTKDESRQLGLPNPTGLFGELYDAMQNEIKSNPRMKSQYKDAFHMTSAERTISFMNRYFVFRKVMTVDAAKKERLFLQHVSLERPTPEMAELEAAFDTEARKTPAVRGEIRRTKIRAKLRKPPSEIFSIETHDTHTPLVIVPDIADLSDPEENEEKEKDL
jgi:hypothetical protein